MENNNTEDSVSDYRDASEDETIEDINHRSRGEGVEENRKNVTFEIFISNN